MSIDDKVYLDKKRKESKKKTILYFCIIQLICLIVTFIQTTYSQKNRLLSLIIAILIVIIVHYLLYRIMLAHKIILSKIETISKNTYMRWDGNNIEDLLSFLNINVSYKVTDDDDLIKSCKDNGVELKKGDFVVKEKNDFYIINFED